MQEFLRPLSIKYLKNTSMKNILHFLSFSIYLSNLSIVVHFNGNIFEQFALAVEMVACDFIVTLQETHSVFCVRVQMYLAYF